MENKDKKARKYNLEEATKENDLSNPHDILIQNIIIANKVGATLTNEEIAAQGFSVRGGHNPNKSNPYTKSAQEISDIEGFNDFEADDYNLKNPSEPYKNFNETEDALEAIDDE